MGPQFRGLANGFERGIKDGVVEKGARRDGIATVFGVAIRARFSGLDRVASFQRLAGLHLPQKNQQGTEYVHF